MSNVYPWQESRWSKLAERLDRLPHALLFAGPAGGGKLDFALALAKRVLCPGARGTQTACGRCAPCNWFEQGNHPDFRLVVPEADAATDEAGSAEPGPEPGSRRGPSRQIRIEQVRALWEFAVIGGHAGGRKVILLRPAEAMNAHTANALLKLLEEPPSSICFILVSNEPQRLLPTLRSRCQAIQFPRPDPIKSRQWLERAEVARPDALLALSGGMPLRAAEMAGTQQMEYWQALCASLARGADLDPLGAAALCEGWLRTRTGSGGVEMRQIVEWTEKWVIDLALVSRGARPRYHVALDRELGRVAGSRPDATWLRCYNALGAFMRSADHPLNPRLFLEDLFIRYSEAAGAAR